MPELYRWPDWMPQPQQADYSYEPVDRRSRTEMEVGSLIRVNFDTDESKITCSLVLDSFQSAWFEAFERDVLAQGSQWFAMPLQSGGQVEWHTVRFNSRPKASVIAPFHTRYNFTLDVEKRPDVICPQLAELLLCVSPQDVCATARDLRHAMQEIVPTIELPDFWDVA